LSLAGKLEDVPLADVMQFIHLGRRTGTLSLRRGNEQAEITFHRGAIVGARSASSRKIGELLVDEGILSPADLDEALRAQAAEPTQRTLGQLLLARGAISMDAVRDVIRAQIERTIYELVTWAHGSFVFELDTLNPVDEIAVFPGDLIPDIDLNTQMVLLEAARIFDERNRADGTATEPAPTPLREREVDAPPRPLDDTQTRRKRTAAADLFDDTVDVQRPELVPPPELPVPELPAAEPPSSLRLPEEVTTAAAAASAAAEAAAQAPPPLQIAFGGDAELAAQVSEQLAEQGVTVIPVASGEAGQSAPGEPVPVVAFELREVDSSEGEASLGELEQICRRRPGLAVICVLDDVAFTAKAYEAGAAAVVPRDAEAIIGCFLSITRFRGMLARPIEAPGTRSAFAKLRRVVADLRSGVFSASVALNLMNIIAESVERAVLFLVRRDSLSVLGAFGFSPNNRPLAEVTRALQVPLEDGSALSEAIHARRALSVSFDQARLPEKMAKLVGRPRTGQVVLFPVLGTDRVILLIYTDNGTLDRPIEEIDIIDLAASEVGIAFENELLRRQLSRERS
jgi:hypothetical protein